MMVEIKDNLYPITNIKNIRIDRANLQITIYFNPGTGLFPVVEDFKDSKKLEEKVRELNGKRKSSRLLG